MPRLLQGERPVLTARQHWVVIVPTVLMYILILVVGMVILGLVPSLIKGRAYDSVSPFLGLLRLLLIVVAVAATSWHWMQWRARTYLLTDQRIVVNRGVVSKLTTSVTLDRVQDTIVHQSLSARLFHCGDIEIESAGRDGTELMHLIPDPQGFANALMTAIEAHRQGRAYPGFQDDQHAAEPYGPGDSGHYVPGPPGQGFAQPVYPQEGMVAAPGYAGGYPGYASGPGYAPPASPGYGQAQPGYPRQPAIPPGYPPQQSAPLDPPPPPQAPPPFDPVPPGGPRRRPAQDWAQPGHVHPPPRPPAGWREGPQPDMPGEPGQPGFPPNYRPRPSENWPER